MKKQLRYAVALCFCSFYNLFAQGGFTKITDASNPITQLFSNARYRGAAWVDANNDGRVDLFAAPNSLYINKGGGKFEVQSSGVIAPNPSVSGCSFADYDNDGDIDLLTTNPISQLYLNDAKGNFSDISNTIPNLNKLPAWACAFGDLNNDAKMDFIFVHPAGFLTQPSLPNKLYKQTAAGPVLITGYEVTRDTQPYTVPFWSDYDLDGDMDLFVSTGPAGTLGPDFCYKNLFKETQKDSFMRLTQPLFASELQDGQTYNFVDIDNDGDLDLCLTNYAGATTRLYRRQADGSFKSETTPFTNALNRLDNAWGDFDNDGDLDVLMTSDGGTPVELYMNDGKGVFTLNSATDITKASRCSGVTIGDYDNDGDLDVFIHGTILQNGTKTFGLYESTYNSNSNKWVNFQCIGTTSNRSAIGTKMRIKATIGGTSTWQMREILAQNTFQGQNDLRVHFGLKDAAKIDSIEVLWLSGKKDVFTNIALNNFYKITEGGALITGIEEQQEKAHLINLSPNPVTDILNIEFDKTLNINSLVEIFDTTGRIILIKNMQNNSIPLSNIPNGIYFIRFNIDKEHIVKKFIINR
jgi:enediyne biosynthesis protein E4